MDAYTILYLATCFILYSFIGWVLECISKTIEEKEFVNSGFLNGPICPIYGLGSILMLACLSFLKDNPILLFFASFIILSVWEYVVGIILEKVFKTKYWDYSHLKFNFQGRICLKNSIYWGILGVAFICFINPFVESYIKLIPLNVLFCIDVVILTIVIIDLIISIATVNNFELDIKKINDLEQKIKELKNKKKNKEEAEKNAMQLKKNHAMLKIRMYRQALRLKKAFPNMKSETITAFLNQKIDLNKLKENIKKKNKE